MTYYNGGDLYDIASEQATDENGYICEDCKVLATSANPCDCETDDSELWAQDYSELMRG